MPEAKTPPTPHPLTGLALGRIVHYVLDGTSAKPESRGRVRAAVVSGVVTDTEVNLGLVNLHVFTGGPEFDGLPITHMVEGRRFDEAHEPGTWHWPERAIAGEVAKG
jgi:hypothetical protein